MPVKCQNRYFNHYWKKEFCKAEKKPCRAVCAECSARAWCTDFEKEDLENDDRGNTKQDSRSKKTNARSERE